MKNLYFIYSFSIALLLILSNSISAQTIYGTTSSGGYSGLGVMFKYTPTPSTEVVVNFGNSSTPYKSAINTTAQRPVGNLIYGDNGIIYGVSAWGGASGSGSIYGYNPLMDTIGILHSFNGTDGSEPIGGLYKDDNGVFYGVTSMGGSNNNYGGVIYSYNPVNSIFTVIGEFVTTTGTYPEARPMEHSNGLLFGTTNNSGTNQKGTLFSIDKLGTQFINEFNFSTTSGYGIYGALCEASNTKLYGFAHNGGSHYFGTIFEYDPNTEIFTVVFNFDSIHGANPQGGAFLYNGKLYGTALHGGTYNQGTLFEYDIASGTVTKLLDFDSTLTGAFPSGTLSMGNDGWLYGSTKEGGAFLKGVFWKFNIANNTFVKIYDFDGVNGQFPEYVQFIETSHVNFSTTDTVLTSPPFNVQFSNQTISGSAKIGTSNYIYQWQFGDGAISYQEDPMHTYTSNGTYSVTLIAVDTVLQTYDTLLKQDYIHLSGAATCPVNASVTPSGFINICPGDSVLLHASSPNSAYSYQWLRTGLYLGNATDTTFWAKQSGYYQVRVDNGSCWTFSNVAFVNAYPTQSPMIYNTGWIAPCSNDSMQLDCSINPGNYQWSTGETSSSIWVKHSGLYTVSVTDNNGCTSTSPIDTVNFAAINAPNICIVGVDSASGKNIIVWNQSSNLAMDSVRVYKETSVQNVFQKIAVKSRTEVGTVIDQNSDPRVTSYRYRLMGVDSCGTETPIGKFHRTIHLQVNIGTGNSWNLHWNKYEGANLGTYHIYRGTDSTQMSLLASVAGNITSYTDFAPPAGNVFYLLKVDLQTPCSPGGSTNYNLSSSNFFNTSDATVAIEKIELHDLNLSVYPNPNNGQFSIKIESAQQQHINLMIFNNLGSVVSTSQFDVNGTLTKGINLEYLSKGVYYIRIQTKKDVVMRKIIIQ